MSDILISICIPVYKNLDFLQRLLDSIASQTYTGYEVILTDDSPDNEVEQYVRQRKDIPRLRYFRNPHPLGSPENWNEALRHASGDWIKIMHDDDWFVSPDSLEKFAGAAGANKADFIFSSFFNVYLDSGKQEMMTPPALRLKALQRSPASLLSKNIIGPPSVVMYRNKPDSLYDRSLKWLVDIDFYYRYLSANSFYHIAEPLVNIGLNPNQITRQSLLNPLVEIPEHFHVLNKWGEEILRQPLVYDAYWRLFRNLQISKAEEFRQYGYSGPVPPVINKMLAFQNRFPAGWLKMGWLSKLAMMAHYARFQHLIARN
ncbi:MAG TPA: glycosyltransferase family 2 protein [Chitinophagaceae bacterium]|nr:glycosyltransferase family 2 protein [Chitinophagaceae bacterium]